MHNLSALCREEHENQIVQQLNVIYIYIMSLRIFCFILAFLQALDYQGRCLYYNRMNNVCGGMSQDLILLKFNLEGNQTITHAAWGETACNQGRIYFWRKIIPTEQFVDLDKNYRINFFQETQKVYDQGVLQQIIQRTRVVNATFYNVPYRCEIIGDGTVQHFGIDVHGHPPCMHYIKCNQLSAKE